MLSVINPESSPTVKETRCFSNVVERELKTLISDFEPACFCFWFTTLIKFSPVIISVPTGHRHHHRQPRRSDRYSSWLHAGKQNRIRQPPHPGPLRPSSPSSCDVVPRNPCHVTHLTRWPDIKRLWEDMTFPLEAECDCMCSATLPSQH